MGRVRRDRTHPAVLPHLVRRKGSSTMSRTVPARLAAEVVPVALALLIAASALAARPEAKRTDAAYTPGCCCNSSSTGRWTASTRSSSPCRVPGRDHWYVTFGNYADHSRRLPSNLGWKFEDGVYWGYGEGGRLCRLNLRTGKLKVLLDDPKGGVRDPQVHYDGQEDPLRLPQRRRASVSPLRDQRRRHRPAATDRRPGRRHRADLLPDGEHRLLLVALPAVCELLVHARGHALPLRRRRQERPHALQQQRPRQHAVDAARRPRALHALGVRRPQPGPLPSPLDDEPRRHRARRSTSATSSAASPCSTPSRSPARSKVVASFSPGHGMPEHLGPVAVVDPSRGPDILASAKYVSKEHEWAAPWKDP